MPKADIDAKNCGIVMPISECDGRPANHWADVLKIIQDAAVSLGLKARLVSETMESNLIHKEILSNIYNDEIVIVDVSGRNPNVFFELGIRMATQKPTVIVKDDTTTYPFDTGPNRFIEYPRDLRHPQMEIFKIRLVEALKMTISHTPENSFIGQLGPFQIPKIEAKEVSANEAILARLDSMERRLIAEHNPIVTSNNESMAVERIELTRHIWARRRGNEYLGLGIRDLGDTQIRNGIADFLSENERYSGAISFRRTSSQVSVLEMQKASGKKISDLEILARAIESAMPF